MNELNIVYNNGHGKMNIYMDYFFPTTQKNFKKILKVIEMDYDHMDEHFERLLIYFNERIAELKELAKVNGKGYWEATQKAADLGRILESGKYPNGTRVPQEKLKQIKEEHKEWSYKVKKTLKDYKSCEKKIEQFNKHLELLKQRK